MVLALVPAAGAPQVGHRLHRPFGTGCSSARPNCRVQARRFIDVSRATCLRCIGARPVFGVLWPSRRGSARPFTLAYHHGEGEANLQTPSPGMWTLPTMLTLLRVASVPALSALWFSAWPSARLASTVLFVAASITDFLDGYLARRMNLMTAFGAFLDPVADKLMVAVVMILISTLPLPGGVAAGNTWFLPVSACIIIGREITISALREWAAVRGPATHAAMAVSGSGKLKTATQLTALTVLLASHAGEHAWGACPHIHTFLCGSGGTLATVLLALADALTLLSMAQYFAAVRRVVRE